jgi:hypothetical protein
MIISRPVHTAVRSAGSLVSGAGDSIFQVPAARAAALGLRPDAAGTLACAAAGIPAARAAITPRVMGRPGNPAARNA